MQFSRLQLIFVLLLYIGISHHVLIMPHLLATGKRDAWVCAIIAYCFLLFWGFLLFLIMKKNQQRQKLYDWMKSRAGVSVSRMVITVFVFYVFIISAISFRDLIQTVNIYFLPLTSSFVVMLPFLLICVWSALSGMKSIVSVSAVLLPLVWLLGIFVAYFTMEEKDYSYIFPVLVDGYSPLLRGTVIILGGSADFLVLLLLQHHMKQSFTFFNIFILITILTGLILGPTMGSLSSFGPSIAADMRFPAFEQWRLVTLGEYISHVDFLAVFQLLSGAIIRISLGLYLLSDTVPLHAKLSKRKVLLIFSFVLAVITVVPLSDMWVQTMIGKYFYPAALIGAFFISLVLLVISYLPIRKGTQNI